MKYNFYSDEKVKKAYDFISDNVAHHNHFALFGLWDDYNSIQAPTIKWNIEVSRENDLIKKKEKERKGYSHFLDLLKNKDKKSYYKFIHFLEHKDIIIKEYHMLSFVKMVNVNAYENYRKKTNINPFSDKIIDLNSIDHHITCLIIIENENESVLTSFADQVMSKQQEWMLSKEKEFHDLGITIALYERKTSQLKKNIKQISFLVPSEKDLCSTQKGIVVLSVEQPFRTLDRLTLM